MKPTAKKIAEIRAIAERLAEVLSKGQYRAWDLGIVDDEQRELISEACAAAADAIVADDYDTFKWAVAVITSTPGLVDADREEKWKVADAAGDVIWKVNRANLSADITAAVDGLLDDIFPAD